MDSYEYVRFDVELASGLQFSVMYSSKQKCVCHVGHACTVCYMIWTPEVCEYQGEYEH